LCDALALEVPASPQTKIRKNEHDYDDKANQINYRVHEKISFSFWAKFNLAAKACEDDPIAF
jgi:hypothetical protein